MDYGESLVEKVVGDDNEQYLSCCRGCINICPILEYTDQNCRENFLRQMYSYNDGQNTCCLMRRSYSANVPFIKAASASKQHSKTATAPQVISSFGKKLKSTNSNGISESMLVESDSEDSDAEFAVHECLRDLIKSRSVQTFQNKLQLESESKCHQPTNDVKCDGKLFFF
uniref:4Fe-4S ferredoxin-type domain-containing protein n=1 Tax=Syphacia muris TaxID=451379 RepID=A0A0N5AKC5_9BILA